VVLHLRNVPTRVATGAYFPEGLSKDVWMLGIGVGLMTDPA
jgi:hypothetical protein